MTSSEVWPHAEGVSGVPPSVSGEPRRALDDELWVLLLGPPEFARDEVAAELRALGVGVRSVEDPALPLEAISEAALDAPVVMLLAREAPAEARRVCAALRGGGALQVVVLPAGDGAAAEALLDAGADEVLAWPPEAGTLRPRLRAILVRAEERGSARAQLAELDRRHRFIYDHAPVMLHTVDAQGRLVSVSDQWLATLGYTREEVLGRSSVEFLTEDSRASARGAGLPTFLATGSCRDVEYQFVCRDGRRREVLLSGIAQRDEAGRILRSYAVSLDVTNRRRGSLSLHEMTDVVDSDFDAALARLLRIDAEHLGVARVGLWEYRSAPEAIRCEALYQRDRDVIEKGQMLYARDYPGYFAALARDPLIVAHDAAHDPRTCEFRESYLDPGGISSMLDVPVWLRKRLAGVLCHEHVGPRRQWTFEDREFALQVGHAIGRVLEARDRHRAEEALRRSEQSFRGLIEHSPFAIAVHRAGRIVYVNAGLRAYLGYGDAEELEGRLFEELVHPDDRAAAGALAHAAMEGSASGDAPREARLQRRDGVVVIAEVSALALEFDGAPAIVTIARDVSERKAMEAQFLLADRMASVGTLAAGVAHEINNPLAFVASNLDFVAEALEAAAGSAVQPEALADAVAEARTGVRRIGSVVRDLKTFARADEEHRGPVDVAEVLEVSVRLVHRQLRHRARLVRDFALVPRVEANASRLGQVFVNLLVNAMQALPERAPEANEIRVATEALQGEVVVTVGDNGAGMTPEVLRRIFDPFFTTKPVGEGTGLGLAVCQNVVDSLGGRIEVSSRPGEGSVFRVVLPALPNWSVRPLPSEKAPPLAPRLRVLVVDDEPLIAQSLRRLLGRDHDVQVAEDALAALALIDAGETFDVVLCDLMMPGMTGMDLHGELARRHPRVAARMVFLTGGAATPQAREFLDGVANPRMQKPFDAEALRRLLAIIGTLQAG